MGREYSPLALIETNFVFTDPRYLSLRPTAKLAYLTLWFRAFHERREVLPACYSVANLAQNCGHDARTCHRAVKTLQQKCLIDILADGRIRVVGVKGKGNIKWKHDAANGVEPWADPCQESHVLEKRREEERREEDLPLSLFNHWLKEKRGQGYSDKELAHLAPAFAQGVTFGMAQDAIPAIWIKEKAWLLCERLQVKLLEWRAEYGRAMSYFREHAPCAAKPDFLNRVERYAGPEAAVALAALTKGEGNNAVGTQPETGA